MTSIPIEHLHSVRIYFFWGIPSTVFCIDSCISGSPRCKVFLPEANNLLSLGRKCDIFKDAQRSRNPFLLEMRYVNTGSCISKFSSSHLSCIFMHELFGLMLFLTTLECELCFYILLQYILYSI